MLKKKQAKKGVIPFPTHDVALTFSHYKMNSCPTESISNIYMISVSAPDRLGSLENDPITFTYYGSRENVQNFLSCYYSIYDQHSSNNPNISASNILNSIDATGEASSLSFAEKTIAIHKLPAIPQDLCLESFSLFDARWTFRTIWNDFILLRSGRVDIEQILIPMHADYYRCIRPSFCELQYTLDGKNWIDIKGAFYGIPFTLFYQKKSEQLKNAQANNSNKKAHNHRPIDNNSRVNSRFYIPVKGYDQSQITPSEIEQLMDFDFTMFMMEIFGDQTVSIDRFVN